MTYYQLLDIIETASKMEIKRAYFAMVKKYPPEKEPEKFKEYRKAYEVLYDDNARAQYDQALNIPAEFKEIYEVASRAMKYGDYEAAIDALKTVLDEYPELQILNSLLGEAYLGNDNSGKALKIYEKLVKQEPANAAYQSALASAYHLRGYRKKALKQYQIAMELDPDNLELYAELSRQHAESEQEHLAWEVLHRGFEHAQENNLDNLILLLNAVILNETDENTDDLKKYLAAIRKKIDNDLTLSTYVTNILTAEIFTHLPDSELMEYYGIVLDFLVEINPENEEMRAIRADMVEQMVFMQMQEDDRISEVLKALTEIIKTDCDCASCKVERLTMEMEMLMNVNVSRKELIYFKKNYPEQFALNADFYQMLIDPKKERRLYESLSKKYDKYRKLYPDQFDGNRFDYDDDDDIWADDDFNEMAPSPYVRPEPKVGRNDPCPCGSGKKYKKCCGVNN